MVDLLPSKHEALSSKPSTPKLPLYQLASDKSTLVMLVSSPDARGMPLHLLVTIE
jgi:hypothetical protein